MKITKFGAKPDSTMNEDIKVGDLVEILYVDKIDPEWLCANSVYVVEEVEPNSEVSLCVFDQSKKSSAWLYDDQFKKIGSNKPPLESQDVVESPINTGATSISARAMLARYGITNDAYILSFNSKYFPGQHVHSDFNRTIETIKAQQSCDDRPLSPQELAYAHKKLEQAQIEVQQKQTPYINLTMSDPHSSRMGVAQFVGGDE